MHLAKNDSRVLLKDRNQTLLIRFTALEDEGFYICNASNRIGSVISTNTLNLIGMFVFYTFKLNKYKKYCNKITTFQSINIVN